MVDVKAKIKPITYVFVGNNFRTKQSHNHATWKVVLYYVEHHQWLMLKQKSNRKLMFLFEKNFVSKLFKTKFLSWNLKYCAVLRRIPSVVDVKAKIKPITYVFVRKTIRFKTLQNKVFFLQSERLCCITSNTISGWR